MVPSILLLVFNTLDNEIVGGGTTEINKIELLSSLTPIISKQYWFFNAYVALFLFIPFLNNLIKQKRNHILCITISVLCFSILQSFSVEDLFDTNWGESFLWFCVLYLIGAYIKIYSINKLITQRTTILVFLISNTTLFLVRLGLIKITQAVIGSSKVGSLYSYTSPFVLISAISLMVFFSRVSIKKAKWISKIAPLSFGVYLIHDNRYFRNVFIIDRLENIYKLSPLHLIAHVIGMALTIFILCLFIDYLRCVFFKVIRIDRLAMTISLFISRVTCALEEGIRTFSEKIESKNAFRNTLDQ